MSLYVGNLSSRTHRGELECVFQRFGRCNVRLKDGYGFVVYESAPNAEKALIALRGRDICGEPLTLTWSNKQPRPLKRFSKVTRSYEPLYGRNSAREVEYTNRKLHSNVLQDYKLGIKQLGRAGRRLSSADMLDEDTSYHHDRSKGYIWEEHCDYKEDLPNEGGNVEPNQLDNDRWGGQLHDHLNGNNVENSTELDQYEHYRNYDCKAEDENHHIAHSDGSHARQSSQEIMGRDHLPEAPLDHPNDTKSWQTCYRCGGSGHKKRNCPGDRASERTFMRFAHRHDDDTNRGDRAEGKLERYELGSQGKLRSYRDSISRSRLGDDSQASGSGRHRRLTKNRISNEGKEADRIRRNDRERKKRRKRNFGTSNKYSEKKTKRSVSFPLPSDYTESRSYSISRSSKPIPRSDLRSRSRSVSSLSCSSTSNSRSSSISHYSRSTCTKSRSKSNSQKSLSLSVSVGQPLPSSRNKVQLNMKGTLANAAIAKSREILVDQVLPSDVGLESAELENSMLAVKIDNVVSSPKLENGMDKNKPMRMDFNDNLLTSTSLHDIADPTTLPLEEGTLTAGSLSPETLKVTREHQNSEASMRPHTQPPIKDSHSEAPVSFHSACSASISSEEMQLVLKHYGLELHDETEGSLPPEAYFGSARLWPWEIIYYRRLKKGPILTENYARRIAQNKEFGIVDKYVRSSSGWGELN